MKIAISCHPTQGGSGIVASELATALAHRGHQVHLAASERPFRLDECSGVVFHKVNTFEYPLFKSPPQDLSLANRLAGITKEFGIDVIHAHYAIPHAVTALLARQIVAPHDVKIVTTLHGTDITLVGSHADFYDLTRHAMTASDGLTAVSDWLRDETQRRFCLDDAPEVIYNFVDTARFNPEGRAPHPGDGGEFRLLHASNLRPVKRIADIIRVFDLVRKHVPARLTIIGDGPEKGMAQELCGELGICDRVEFSGVSGCMPSEMREAHMFFLLSDYESFGLSALEAMACGTPVAVSSGGGLPEVVEDGVTGLLCDPGDVKCTAAATVELLTHRDKWEAMSAAAAESSKRRFSLETVITKYEALYERLIAND